MIRRPPRSPLFPSTPLSRSIDAPAMLFENPADDRKAEPGALFACRDIGFEQPAARTLCHRSEEHTSELQSRSDLVCRLLLEKKKNTSRIHKTRKSDSCELHN